MTKKDADAFLEDLAMAAEKSGRGAAPAHSVMLDLVLRAKYIIFTLEAEQREAGYLRKMLEQYNGDDK